MKFKTTKTFPQRRNGPILARFRHSSKLIPLFLFTLLIAVPLAGRSKEKLTYGEGLIINIPVPESEVEQVVEDVVQNGVIRGTKEYNKDEFVAGAKPVASTHVFPAWEQGGKVFYKVREQAIDPRNFKDTSDVGTLAVRYVVQAQGEKNTVLHIDALFKEDYRHIVHQSNGSVENAEYKDIREHLDTIEVMKKQNIEAEKEREEYVAKKQNRAMPSGADTLSSSKSNSGSSVEPASQVAENAQPAAMATVTMPAPQETPPAEQSQVPQSQPLQTLEQHVKELRKQVERLVKSPGAPLKSAPFHTAGTLVLLPEGTEVLIVINTPYWYGVETHDGQHGWMQRDELELLP